MIKLTFVGPARKIVRFDIEERKVRYFDDIWKSGVQVYPRHDSTIKRLSNSRNADFKVLAALLIDANQGKDLKEYNSCKTEEDIANFIRKDCKSKGLMEARR